MDVTHKLDGAGDGWWTGSVRPDLWTPGEWNGVKCTADSSRWYLAAFQGRLTMTDGGGVVLHGPARWKTNAAPGGFAVPSELRCPFAPTPKFPQSIMIGSEGDVGGMMDGSWIIGQFGTVVSAERVEVDA